MKEGSIEDDVPTTGSPEGMQPQAPSRRKDASAVKYQSGPKGGFNSLADQLKAAGVEVSKTAPSTGEDVESVAEIASEHETFSALATQVLKEFSRADTSRAYTEAPHTQPVRTEIPRIDPSKGYQAGLPKKEFDALVADGSIDPRVEANPKGDPRRVRVWRQRSPINPPADLVKEEAQVNNDTMNTEDISGNDSQPAPSEGVTAGPWTHAPYPLRAPGEAGAMPASLDAAPVLSEVVAEASSPETSEPVVESRESQEAHTLRKAEDDLLAVEQMAAFYANHYGKDNPVTKSFEEAQAQLEKKMHEELFAEWASRHNYTGAPKRVESPTPSPDATIPGSVVYAPYTQEDLDASLKASNKDNAVYSEADLKQMLEQGNKDAEVERVVIEQNRPLIMQSNEHGDNIIIMRPEQALEKRDQEPALPEATRDSFKKAYDEAAKQTQEETAAWTEKQPRTWKDRLKRGWGWTKERMKGVVTLGYWEVHQAERFRSSTKEVAKDIEARASEIEKTKHLSLDDALAEAEKIQFALRAEAKEDETTGEDYERLSQMVTAEKVTHNNRIIDETVRQAESEIVRRLEKYRDQWGEHVVRDESAVADMKNRIREELVLLQDGQKKEDVKAFKGAMRQSLDPKYWSRYVYGGVELALDAAAINFVVTKICAEQAVAAGAKVGGKAIEGQVQMHNTVWQSAKELLMNHGVANPSNKEVLNLSQEMCKLNHIGVQEWGISGNPMDTVMRQGYLLKIPKVAVQAILRSRGLPV